MRKDLVSVICVVWLAACCSESAFSRASYETTFVMATCGNILNTSYYSPDKGPEGFVDYRFYFSEGFSLSLKRDFSAILTYRLRGSKETVALNGAYLSPTVNSGVLRFVYDGTREIDFFWLKYYEVYFTWSFFDVVSSEEVTAVSLLHSNNIFSN